MAANNIISSLIQGVQKMFREAVSMTKAFLQARSLGLGALGVSLGGSASMNSIATPPSIGHNRGGPGNSR